MSPRFGTALRRAGVRLLGQRERTVRNPPAEATALRPFDRLVALQRADGSWELSSDLAEILGRPLAELERSLPAADGKAADARRAWATALALAWLEARPELQVEWELLADKARGWLSQLEAQPRDGTSWTEAARRVSLAIP
jgi:hypothetical protein